MAVGVPANAAAASAATPKTSPDTAQSAQPADSARAVDQNVLGNTTGGGKATPMAVPEPSTMALAGLGVAGLWAARRRK